jgi:hypothetical protein
MLTENVRAEPAMGRTVIRLPPLQRSEAPEVIPGERKGTWRGELPAATVCHRSRQRLRLRIASRRGDTAFFDRVRDDFAAGAVFGVPHVNAVTGSILFSAPVAIQTVRVYAEALGLFTLAAEPRQIVRADGRGRAPLTGPAAALIGQMAVTLLRALILDLLVCRGTAIAVQARIVFRF